MSESVVQETELRTALAKKEEELGLLLEEIHQLERGPKECEERLVRLERYFGDLRRGDAVPLHSEALHAVGKVMKDEEARQIAEDVAHGRVAHRQHCREHTETGNFVLGRGFMAIDRWAHFNAIDEAQRRNQFHPVIDDVYYTQQHLPRQAEAAPVVFMGPGGFQDRTLGSLQHGARDDQFWLDRSPLPRGSKVATPPAPLFSTDVASPAAAAIGGGREDTCVAVDWLGLKRRNMPVPEDVLRLMRQRGVGLPQNQDDYPAEPGSPVVDRLGLQRQGEPQAGRGVFGWLK